MARLEPAMGLPFRVFGDRGGGVSEGCRGRGLEPCWQALEMVSLGVFRKAVAERANGVGRLGFERVSAENRGG